MNIVLGFLLYIIVGSIVAFAFYYLHLKAGDEYYGDDFTSVMVGVFWPAAAPFAFAIFFAKEMNRRR